MKTLMITIFLLAVAFPAHADQVDGAGSVAGVSGADSKVSVKPGEAVIEVSGVVCSFCAYGLQRKVSKLDFIDRSKYQKGVKIDIQNQQVIFAIKSGQKFKVDQLVDEVKAGGYEPLRIYFLDDKGNIKKIELQEDEDNDEV